MSDTQLLSGSVSLTEKVTRKWIANHVIEHTESGLWRGCMICVGLRWGAELGVDGVSTSALEQVAAKVGEKGLVISE